MFATLLKALSDSLISSLFEFLKAEMHDRGLIQAGREAQHTDDLQATVNEATDAARIREGVQATANADLDGYLERLRTAPQSRP